MTDFFTDDDSDVITLPSLGERMATKGLTPQMRELAESLATHETEVIPPRIVPVPEPGIYTDISMEDYLAMDCMNASGLELLGAKSPKQYRYWRTARRRETTSALERGTALHLAVLEPHLFTDHYIVIGQCAAIKKGDGQRCTNQGTVYRDGMSYCKTQGHDPDKGAPMDPEINIITQLIYDSVLGMRAAIHEHDRARSLFEGKGEFEATVIFDDPETGVRCKIRPDRLIKRAGMLVDIKTCADASDEGFARAAERLGYWRKMALYRRGLRAIGWPYQCTAVVAPEATAPHDLQCFLLEEEREGLDSADAEVSRALRRYKHCLETDTWPGYSNGVEGFAILRRPTYAIARDAA